MRKYILIGLGNKGKKYAATRHNSGKMFAKWLQKNPPQKEYPFEANKLEAIETDCFMNSSGDWVYNYYKNQPVILSEESATSEGSSELSSDIHIGGNRLDCHVAATAPRNDKGRSYSNLIVAHDDLDLPLGRFKIQFGRGPHDHKGLNSIYQSLGTKKFWHVRIGIDNRNKSVIAKTAFGGLWQSRPQTDSHAPPSGARNDSQGTSLRGAATTWQSGSQTDSHGAAAAPRNDNQHRESGESYTLKPFGKEEKEVLENTFIKIKIDLVQLIERHSEDPERSRGRRRIQRQRY